MVYERYIELIPLIHNLADPGEAVAIFASKHRISSIQWEFQDAKMEALYHIKPYFVVIFHYIGPIYGRYLHFRILKFPLIYFFCFRLCRIQFVMCHDQRGKNMLGSEKHIPIGLPSFYILVISYKLQKNCVFGIFLHCNTINIPKHAKIHTYIYIYMWLYM